MVTKFTYPIMGIVRPSRTPTKRTRSLGRFGDEMNKEQKEETIGWVNKDVGYGQEHLRARCDE
jgi:hypothetical protein